MALKRENTEPTVSDVIRRARAATMNPNASNPITPKYLLDVCRKLCYNTGPSDPWEHQLPCQKNTAPRFDKQT